MPMMRNLLASIAVPCLFGLAALPAFAQPRIADLRLLILDQGEEVGSLGPGETLRMAVGETLRLRMSAIPAESGRSTRYPATTFSLGEGARRLQITRQNVEVGNVTFKAVSANDPRNPRSVTTMRWHIEDPWIMPDGLRDGFVVV